MRHTLLSHMSGILLGSLLVAQALALNPTPEALERRGLNFRVPSLSTQFIQWFEQGCHEDFKYGSKLRNRLLLANPSRAFRAALNSDCDRLHEPTGGARAVAAAAGSYSQEPAEPELEHLLALALAEAWEINQDGWHSKYRGGDVKKQRLDLHDMLLDDMKKRGLLNRELPSTVEEDMKLNKRKHLDFWYPLMRYFKMGLLGGYLRLPVSLLNKARPLSSAHSSQPTRGRKQRTLSFPHVRLLQRTGGRASEHEDGQARQPGSESGSGGESSPGNSFA